MNILELEADFGARCQTADGQDHPLEITWTYDSSIFTPTTTAVSDSIILTLDLDSIGDEPLKKDIIFSVRDTLNSSTVVETVSIDILPELICELAFSFPGNEANSSDVYNLAPERSHILASKIDCSLPEGNYTTKSSTVRVFKYSASISDSGVVTQINNDDQLIYSYDKGTSKPAFEFVTAVFFADEEQSGFKITVDDFEDQNAPLNPIYANVQYKSLIPSATIVQRHDNFGAIKPINSMEYEEKTTASVLNFILDASRSKNPNTTPGALSYNWAVVGDSSNLSLASNNTTATAIVSGLAPFESKEWTIRMTISDQSAKAKSTSTDLKIKIEQDNSLPILTNLQIPGRNIYNNVSVTFDLYDLEGEHSSIQFEYSTDGAEWLTSAATVERSEPLSNTSPGFFKGFIWQAHRSLPSGNYASAQIRLTPTDTYDRLGNTEISEPFLLSVPQAPQASATIIDRICRDNDGETTINIESTSYNGGCVTETIDFHLDGFNDPHPYEDSFRFSWSSNSITTYQFIREIFKQNADGISARKQMPVV